MTRFSYFHCQLAKDEVVNGVFILSNKQNSNKLKRHFRLCPKCLLDLLKPSSTLIFYFGVKDKVLPHISF